MARLHFLVTLILCALVASRGGVAADNEIQDGPVTGTQEALEDDVLDESAPLEPGATVFQVQNGTTAVQGPPEPSTRPAFSGGSTTAVQGPPEPSTRPEFTGGADQGPPEPSTTPEFTRVTNQGPPEPSTRPAFSGGATASVQPSTRPVFSSVSNIPEPSRGQPVYTTQSRTSSSSSSSVVSVTNRGPPEPSSNPEFFRESTYRPSTRTSYPTQRPTVVVRPSAGQPGTYPHQPSYPYYPAPSPPRYQYEPPVNNDLSTPVVVRNRYGRPFYTQVWRCDISRNNCFLRNRFNFVPFVRQNYFENTYYALVLDVAKAARHRHGLTRRPNPVYSYNAARLETTSYFPANGVLPDYADACIAFSYYWSGQGKKSVHVLQRITDDDCIYSNVIDPADANSLRTLGQWQDVQLQVDLRHGAAKFWIEWQFDIGRKNDSHPYYDNLGFLAIRNFTIGYGTCTQPNAAWECDIPLSR